jgi:DNA-binding transcriptional regulator of glucitol operon
MQSTATAIILLLAGAWLLQYFMAYLQLRRFYKRVAQLHRLGSVWRRRTYAILVVDKNERVVKVEQLSGWTVWAVPKPVPGLEAITLDTLMNDSIDLPVNRKLRLALQNAVGHIRAAEERKQSKSAPAEETSSNEEVLGETVG